MQSKLRIDPFLKQKPHSTQMQVSLTQPIGPFIHHLLVAGTCGSNFPNMKYCGCIRDGQIHIALKSPNISQHKSIKLVLYSTKKKNQISFIEGKGLGRSNLSPI